MKNSRLVCSLAASLLFTATFLLTPTAAPAADAAAEQAKRAPQLPLETSFEKQKSGETPGLYVLTLKNTSTRALKVSAAIEESVVSHNRPKNRTLPAQEIAADKSWKIDGLAAHDKVVITADGFAPLALVVP